MSDPLPFRFTTPPPVPPDAKLITAEEAEQHLLRQLQNKERPEEEVLWELARLYSQTGEAERAFALVQQLVEKVDTLEKKAGCYLAMGQLSEQVQHFDMAIKYYSQALALEPVDGRTWYFIKNNLGFCLNHFGRYAEAELYVRRAIKIDPLRHNAYKNLGIALEGQGDYAGAGQCFIKAVQMNASDPRALRHLEQLVQRQPTVAIDVPDFDEKLKACQAAVQKASQVRAEMMQQLKQKSGKDS